MLILLFLIGFSILFNIKYKINKNLILQKMDNNLVGFDVERSFIYTFNETAEFIFKKIKLGWVEEKITANLAKKYVIKEKLMKEDVQELVKDLLKKKIIKRLKSDIKDIKLIQIKDTFQ